MDALHTLLDTLRAQAATAAETAHVYTTTGVDEKQAQARIDSVASHGIFQSSKSIFAKNTKLLTRKLLMYYDEGTEIGASLRENAYAYVNWDESRWSEVIRSWGASHKMLMSTKLCRWAYTNELISAGVLLAAYCGNDIRSSAILSKAIKDTQRRVDESTPINAEVFYAHTHARTRTRTHTHTHAHTHARTRRTQPRYSRSRICL